jgi:multiple sugar transport system substrate-binding protein
MALLVRKHYLILAVIVLGGLVLTSCAQVPTAMPEPATEAPQATSAPKVELDYWYFGGLETEIKYLAERTEDFNKLQDRIHVTFSNPAFGERRTKLVTCSQTNTCADVIGGQGDEAPDYARLQNGAALDVEFPEVLTWEDRFYPAAWEDCWRDGHLYCIPHNGNFGYLLANKEMFDAAGLGHPADEVKTWDDLVRVAEQLTNDEHYGIALDMNKDTAHFMIQFALYGAGCRPVSADAKLQLNNPGMLAVLKLYRDLYPYMPASALEEGYIGDTKLYIQGKVAMIFTGSWFPGVAPEQGYTMKPTDILINRPISAENYCGEIQARNLNGQEVWYLNPRSKHKAEAWEFFKFLSNDETLNAWGCRIIGRVPTVKSALKQPCAKEANPSLVALDEAGLLWKDVLPQPSVPGQTAYEPILSVGFLKGLTTPEDQLQQTLDEVQERAEPIYEKAKGEATD